MRPGMWSMATLSFDSGLYAAFFPALSGKTAGSPAPGPVRHFRPMATILSRTRPSGWGGRGHSRCARSALSSACSATGGAGGRSGSRQRVPRHFASRGSSHTRRRGASVARPGGWPAVRPWRCRRPAALWQQPSCPGPVQVQAITGRTRWRSRQCSATHPAARGGADDAGPCTRTPGSSGKRWLRTGLGRFSARASADRPMARSRAPPGPARRRETEAAQPAVGGRHDPVPQPATRRARPALRVVADHHRLPAPPVPVAGHRPGRTAPSDASGPSTDMSGKSATRHLRREPDGTRAAGRPGPSLSAIPRTARRPAERTGSPRAFRQPSRSQSSNASEWRPRSAPRPSATRPSRR